MNNYSLIVHTIKNTYSDFSPQNDNFLIEVSQEIYDTIQKDIYGNYCNVGCTPSTFTTNGLREVRVVDPSVGNLRFKVLPDLEGFIITKI